MCSSSEICSDERLTEPWVFDIAGLRCEAIRIVTLAAPGDGPAIVELLEYQGATMRPQIALPCDPGNGHLCLAVADLERVHRRLIAAGSPIRSARLVLEIPDGRAAGAKALYATDPDGYHVEFFQVRRAA